MLSNGIDENKIPNITSMTYNRWNKGMSAVHINPLFEHIGERGKYRFLGPDYNYTGDVFNYNRGQNRGGEKIAFWINGELFDYEERLSNYKFKVDLDLKKKEQELVSSDCSISQLEKLGWYKLGSYKKNTEEVKFEYLKYPENKNIKLDLVYILSVENEVKYIGKTTQGYNRPTSYHKNGVMTNVKNGVHLSLDNGKEVEVFIKIFGENDLLDWKGFNLNIVESIERALIGLCGPEWNRYKPKN